MPIGFIKLREQNRKNTVSHVLPLRQGCVRKTKKEGFLNFMLHILKETKKTCMTFFVHIFGHFFNI